MGRYARKSKVGLDVTVMDVSRSYLGVRTRAKTLALQRSQSGGVAAPRPLNPDTCYLELRSRRLEKPMPAPNLRNVRHGCGCRAKPGITGHEPCYRTVLIADEASYGENGLDSQTWERGSRETTPCNLIRTADVITTPPGSTTKGTCSIAANQSIRNSGFTCVPSACELDDFFTPEEELMQQSFIERYNFDIINDLPLPGRFEWVAVRP